MVPQVDALLRDSQASPAPRAPEGHDVYLSPHSDDTCFSLGVLAHRRRSGIHLTIFPYVRYVAKPGLDKTPDATTPLRMAEDMVFAARCGLQQRFLALADSDMLRIPRYKQKSIAPCLARTEPAVLGALASLAKEHPSGMRPWLFCPMGIGGHMDHVATRLAVTRNLTKLSRNYRVAFYEDLHYASNPEIRQAGLADFMQDISGLPMRRVTLPLEQDAALKLSLLQGYPSQFATLPPDIESFTPGLPDAPPHEALWTTEEWV